MFNSGFRGRRENDGQGSINPQAKYVQTKYPQPYISGWSISGSDDTALNPAGGQTVLVNGSGFATGISATLGGSQIGSVTLVNPTQISFTAPANAGGSYTLIVYNSTGGAAILVPGLTYSSVPTWTTAAGSIGSYYETTAINSNVVATSDSALTYTLSSGSLPSGATLYANGVITGTAPVDSGSTTYTFNITATDAELQDTTRTFTMTINVDVVTWVTPTNGTTYTVPSNVAISNVSLSATDAAGYGIVYSANSLPTGVSITGSVITGTPTTSGNTSTLLTATANTTGRTSTNTINWVVQLGDSYWNLTTLALNSLPTTTPFQSDASLNNASITVAGDTKSSPYNPYQTGYYSNYFDGNGDYLSITSGTTTTIPSGNNAYTMEAWVYATALGTSSGIMGWGAYNTTNAVNALKLTSSNTIVNYWWANDLTSSAVTGLLNAWNHIAATFDGTTRRIFYNGALVGSDTPTGHNVTTVNNVTIGFTNGVTANEYFTGYISNARIVNGLALYTTTFTPGTAPLVTVAGTSLLTCQSQRLIDTSPNNFAITKNGDTTAVPANPFATVYDYGTTYYSTYFDGTGDYFTAASGSIFTLGTGDFTIEAWIYPTSSSGTQGVLGLADTGGAGDLTFFYNLTSGKVTLNAYGGTAAVSTASVSTNVWTHVAFARASGSLKTFINGVLDNTTAFTGNFTKTAFVVGRSYSTLNQEYFVGQVSNLRVIKGQAIYTAAFTPSTTTLTTTSQGATAANVSILTCQSSTLIDNSLNALAITSNGDARPVPQSPFYSAYYSGYFDGSGDYLSINYSTGSTISGDFTWETWAYDTGTTYGTLLGWRTGSTGWSGFVIQRNNSSNITVAINNSAATITQTSATYLSNQWNHVAVVRSGTTVTLYVNGTSAGTATLSGSFNPGSSYWIGSDPYNNVSAVQMKGYVSNQRFVNGTAIYTSAFTPPTSPLTAVANTGLLTCQSLYFIDNSTNIFTVTVNGNTAVATVAPFTQPSQYGATTAVATYGSGYFDGTGDYLNAGSNGAYAFSTGAYTIELWVYHTSLASVQVYNVNQTTGGLQLWFDTTQGLSIGKYGSSPVITSGLGYIVVNQWNHIAVSRVSTSASSTRMFVNGVAVATGTDSNDYTITGPLYIGSQSAGNGVLGYISNFRMVKGTALYTANFLPGPTPLTAVTNTQLLTLQYNGGSNDSQFRDGSNFQNLITRNGNATQGTFSPFSATGWSAYFDGSGDYIYPNNSTGLGSGDFTIEAWIYPTVALQDQKMVFDWRPSAGTTSQPFLELINSASVQFIRFRTGAYPSGIVSAGTVVTNAWNHVAVTRSGSGTNNVKLFINGTMSAQATNTDTFAGASNRPYLGCNDVASTFYTGYISNARIVIGSALYTATFTPSTTPLVAVTGTNLLTLQSPAFIDNSANRFTITTAGDTKTQSFSPFSGVTTTQYYSNYFDGTGDYLNLAANAAFAFGTGDFTVECWVNYTNKTNSGIFQIGATLFPTVNGIGLGLDNGPNWMLYYGNGSQTAAVTGPTNGVWYHVAVVRSSSVTKVYVNGSSTISTADSANYTGSTLGIAGIYSTSYLMNGYISNFRVTKGQALYTTTFTPSTSPLTTTSQGATAANVSLLTCQSSTFIDNSTNAFAITVNGDAKPTTIAPFAATSTTLVSYTTSVNGGSMYFDGTGDYLTLPLNNLATTMGYSDFTIEAWIYPTTYSGTQQVIACGQGDLATAAGASWVFYIASSVTSDSYSGSTAIAPGSPNPVKNQWSHVAYVRSGTSLKTYLNGVLAGSASFASATTAVNVGTATYPQSVGGFANGSGGFAGYISNFRVTKSALYTAAFVPPNTPATNSVATTELIAGTNGSIIDYTGKNDLETVADARLAPQNPYGGSYYSNYFDGTGDYLSASTSAVTLGSGDYTIEFWMNTTQADAVIIDTRASGGTTGWLLSAYTSYTINLTLNGTSILTSSNAFTPGTWNHIAVVRSSGVMKIYINGTNTNNVSNASNWAPQNFNIGQKSWTSSGVPNFIGWLSNLRIVIGQAIYTTNFTPATSPLTTTSQSATAANVSLLTCQSSTFKDNSTNAFTITRNGDTAVNSANPFQNNGTYSMYFDGTGDYNYIPATANFQFGTGDFTIECWLYLNSVASNQIIYDNRNGANGAYPTIYMNTSSIRYYTNSADQITGATLTTGQWYYIAVCKASGSTRLFVNGTQSGSTFADSMNYLVAPLRIGADYIPSSYLNGYVTDLRVTKYARYTTTFTPPTSTFQTK